MPPILTTNASVICAHGGRVILVARQPHVQIQGGGVLCEPDLVGAAIIGCPQPPSAGSKPCTVVASTLPGSASARVAVGSRPVYLTTLTGLTDGVPPAPIQVVSPGQTTVHG